MRRIAVLGFLVFAVSVVTGIMNVTEDWNGIPVRVGGLELAITIYPPFILGLLAAVWIGPTWGILPVLRGEPRRRRSSAASPRSEPCCSRSPAPSSC